MDDLIHQTSTTSRENKDMEAQSEQEPELSLKYKNSAIDLISPTSLEDLELQPGRQPNLRSDVTGRITDPSELPPTDYYLYETNNAGVDLNNDYPVARCVVESATKFFIERNLFAHLHSTYEPIYNSFQDEDIELESLAYKPPSFVIFGKPGIGVTSLAMKLVDKLKSVYISPGSVVDYFKKHGVPKEANISNEEVQYKLHSQKLLGLVHNRIRELDVLHKGYVMDGIPMIRSDDMNIEDQMELIYKFPIKPQYIILMHMQDIDLFRRRSMQKIDAKTGKVYTRTQYINKRISDDNLKISNSKYKGGGRQHNNDDENSSNSDVFSVNSVTADNKQVEVLNTEEDEPRDFEPLSSDVIDRLISREEDVPSKIKEDFDNFRNNMHHLEKFVGHFDRRKVLELNAYYSPSVLLKMVLEFTDSFGITPTPIPVKLVHVIQPKMYHNIREEEGELTDAEGVLEEQPCVDPQEKYIDDTDWEAVLRGCTVRGRVDPRFRWRISRWKNLCPVALKHGRSIAGKPELAVGFMDKVYFMSSEESIELFQFNPRPYLLPTMPSSPIKFYVVGHPLAGKSLFSQQIAKKCDAYVIDMEREVRKRMHLVKFDYLFRTRLEAVLEMTDKLDKEYYQDWKRQERERREEVFKWIDEFVRRMADEVLNTTLQLEKGELKKQRDENVAAAATHELGDIFYGGCQTVKGDGFTWTEFVKQIHEGKRHWTHQEKLELAWHLFRTGKLKYKVSKEEMLRLMRRRQGSDLSEPEIDGEWDESSGDETLSNEEDEDLGSSDDEEKYKRRKKRRRRPKCKPIEKIEKVVVEQIDDDDFSVDLESRESSVFGPNEETDESIKMRYPEIPPALIFSIPMPAKVTDKHPEVEEYVLIKMCEAEKWAEGQPPELYAEVLRRAIKEVESKYLEKNNSGPLSGGWVVENLAVDADKWRACLRHEVTAPDNIIGLLDYTPDHVNILARLKKLFRTELHSRQLKAFMKEVGEAAELYGAEINGEDGGEGFPFPLETDGKNSTEILMDRLPKNDLTDSYDTAKSQVSAHKRDLDRQVSLADSELDITADPKKLLEEWFKTFDPKHATPISEVSSGPYSQPKPEIEQWIARHINYEMLTRASNLSRPIRSSEEETSEAANSLKFDEKTSGEQIIKFEKRVKRLTGDFQGAEPSFLEIGGENNLLRTPSGLLSEPDILCGEDGRILGPEDAAVPVCIPKIHSESPIRQFLRLVSIFDEFWNMAVPVIHGQQIRYWEMGVVDEDTVRDKIHIVLDDLEGRFNLPPKKVEESELMEEVEEWEESNILWGVSTEKTELTKEDEGEIDKEIEGESNNEDDESDSDQGNEANDRFAELVNKPDEYMKAISRVDEMRLYGDLKDYCPVTLHELGVMRKGFTKFAAKYRDKLYFMANEEYFDKFLQDPVRYLPIDKPFDAPAPRICITGSPGCGQEKVAIQLVEDYKIYYVNFRQRLQELIRVKVGKMVGPEAFDFSMRDESLLGLKESNSSFELPSIALLEASRTTVINDSEYEGEGGDDYMNQWATMIKRREFDMLPVKKLGDSRTASLAMCPISNIDRTEKIAGRDWLKMSRTENAIKDFLEMGAELPDFVLDKYIAPLWQEEPFKSKGFILVGFPNTGSDMNYLVKKNFIPEFIYVLDCKFKAMRNRLLMKSVDEWHKKHPNRQKNTKTMKSKLNDVPVEFLNQKKDTSSKITKDSNETWTYKDDIAHRVSASLYKYHNLCTQHLKKLKIAMNLNRINWMNIHADISLKMAELELTSRITTSLKYRSSIFESTYVLTPKEANVLIERGFYRLSKFGRWCPVNMLKENSAVNLWNAPGVENIPILYRNYIYYIAGEKNAKYFRENVCEVVKQDSPKETMPLFIIIVGNSQTGKTSLAEKLAYELGLVHIKQEEILQNIINHSFVNSVANYNMSPDILNAGPQSMKMADEILAYLRKGHKVPQYMSYRALDFALMAPRAQFHGVVFDNYPMEDPQLQEFLERGIVPTVVVNLQMDIKEAYRRAESKRFDPNYNYKEFTEECDNYIDYLYEDYEAMITSCLCWLEDELQCVLNVDACLSPSTIFKTVVTRSYYAMNHLQRYIHCGMTGQPAVLEGTGPLTSLLESRLSPIFKNYDPVALNETNDLIKVGNVKELSLKRVVEYKTEIYVFSRDKHVEMFLMNPQKYTHPDCVRVPPKVLPRLYTFNEKEMTENEDNWGFQDFDPVFYHEGNFQYKWLKRGQSKYCVEYESRLYFFLSADNLDKFMKQPQEFCSMPLPHRFPAKTSPKPLDSLSPSGYFIASDLSQDMCHLLTVMATKRPRFPFMSLAKSGVLFMGYYLKSLNMKSSSELRTHYRKAMTHMLNTQSNAEKIAKEIEQLHGKKTITHETKKRIQTFMNLSLKSEKNKVLDPLIPNLPFSYESADDPEKTIFKSILTELENKNKLMQLVEQQLKFGLGEFNKETSPENRVPYMLKEEFF